MWVILRTTVDCSGGGVVLLLLLPVPASCITAVA